MIEVSVILLVYNHQRFLRKAIESVLMQETTFRYEVVIGDDASTDGSENIIKEYQTNYPDIITLIQQKANSGIFVNLGSCLSKCKGKYIALLEGDDYWCDKRKLQIERDYLANHQQNSAVAHNYVLVDSNSNVIRTGLETKKLVDYNITEMEKFRLPSQTSTLMIRNITSSISQHELQIIKAYSWMPADRLFAILLLKHGKITVIPKVMSAYRYYIENNGTNWSSQHHVNSIEANLERYRIMCGMESLSEEVDIHLNLSNVKEYILKKTISEGSTSDQKWKYYWLCVRMLLSDRKRLRMLSKIIFKHVW